MRCRHESRNQFVLKDFPNISGKLFYRGGLRVIENGEGIGWLLPRLMGWLGLEHFATEYAMSCRLEPM